MRAVAAAVSCAIFVAAVVGEAEAALEVDEVELKQQRP